MSRLMSLLVLCLCSRSKSDLCHKIPLGWYCVWSVLSQVQNPDSRDWCVCPGWCPLLCIKTSKFISALLKIPKGVDMFLPDLKKAYLKYTWLCFSGSKSCACLSLSKMRLLWIIFEPLPSSKTTWGWRHVCSGASFSWNKDAEDFWYVSQLLLFSVKSWEKEYHGVLSSVLTLFLQAFSKCSLLLRIFRVCVCLK